MKILSIFLLFTMCMVRVYGQSKLPLRADTVTVEKTGGVANFQVKDVTKDSMGIVYNIGNGVYRNKRVRKINDSTFVAGNDTISLRGGSGGISPSDTTNKWVNNLRRRSGTDSVEIFKNGSWQFSYKDSTGGAITDGDKGDLTVSSSGTVWTIDNNAVTTSKINNAAVTVAKIGATGTPDGTTVLYGNGTWGAPPAGGADSASITHDSLFTNSNTVKVAIPFLSLRNRRVSIQVDTLFGTGTSQDASYGLTNVNHGNLEILADRLKMVLLNHALGGLDIEAACVEVSANIRPGVNKYMQTSAVGYNLLRYAGNNDSAYKQLQDGLRSIIGTNIIDTIFYGDNARITQFGTWGTSTYAAYGGKSGAFGGQGLYSNANNDSLKINITGDAIIIGYLNQVAMGGESGTFNIYVDNVLKKTINAVNACGVSDGTYSNQTTPGAVLLSGLGAGMHTVRIVNTQAKYLYFDYIATTKATNECAPVIISLIPKMTAAGYAVAPANASDAIFNKGDSVIMYVVNEFSNYPVTVAYPNDYFNPATMTQGDNVHHTEAGQAARANAYSLQIFTSEKIPAGSVSQWSNTSGGIYFPSGNVGIGSTATSPATALQLKSSAPAFRIDDTNGDNAAFYSNFTNFAQLAINRNPSTGVFTNTGKAAAQISLKADAGEGSILFYATNTNNTSPTQHAILDGVGNWGFGSIVAPTARLHLPGVSTSAGSAPIKIASGTLMTVPEAGAIEFASSHLWFTIGSTRYQLDQQGGSDGNGIYGGSGSLPSAVTITGAANALTLTGTQSSAAAFNVNNTGNGEALSATTTGTGSALSTVNSSSGPGATISSNSGHGVNVTSTSGTLFRGIVNPSSTNTEVVTIRTIRQSSSTPLANMGNVWSMDLEDDNLNNLTAVQHKAIWTSPTSGSASAEYQLWSYNSGTFAKRFGIKPTGQLNVFGYGSLTHTGTPVASLQVTSGDSVIVGPVLAAGTYTPTLTAEVNITTSSITACQYMRVGNVVTVSGKLTIDYTASGNASVDISLPIASSIGNDFEVAGTANTTSTNPGGVMVGNATTNTAMFFINSPTSGGDTFYFTFTYHIL